MAAKSRSSVFGMQSRFLVFAEDERLYDFEHLRRGIGEVLLRWRRQTPSHPCTGSRHGT
jgi:hypothetical protein